MSESNKNSAIDVEVVDESDDSSTEVKNVTPSK